MTVRDVLGKVVQRGLYFGAALMATGCSRYPADLRDWSPGDHNHTTEARGQVPAQSEESQTLEAHGLDQVILAAWTQQCTRCHGIIGRGNGPDGPAAGAPDLSRTEWQASVTDQQLITTIRQGRGKMPAFDLPPPTLSGLVRLVRLMDRSRAAAGSSSTPASSAMPTSSSSTTPPSASQFAPTAAPSGSASGITSISSGREILP